jgi:Domain of unknown function (DUF6484)
MGVAMTTTHRVDGVVVGLLMGFRDQCALVVFPGNPREAALPARSTVALTPSDVGAQVALVFKDGDAERPLVIGKVLATALATPAAEAPRDGKRLTLAADEEIELRVGKASILMHADGRITLRGARIVSQASGANRIRGGSVHLN